MLNLLAPRQGRPYIIAHRGASGEAPENTMLAFELALAQGADLLELDVHLSSDGGLVVMHDFAVNRTTDGHGLIQSFTTEEILSLDAAAHSPGAGAREAVPLLENVLDWAMGRCPIAIEIKSGPVRYHGIEGRLAETIASHGAIDSTIVISFDHGALLRLKRTNPAIATGVLYACAPVDPSALAMAAHADAILPNWANLTSEMVEGAHANGLAISTWAVDDERDLGWVVSMGVDAVATNYPGRLARMLGERSEP